MQTRVVCISRTVAAGGEGVGRLVAERLGFGYFDDEIIRQAAEKANVDPRKIEQAEHRQSLIQRLLDSLATLPVVAEGGVGIGLPVGVYSPGTPLPPPGAEDFRNVIREVIREVGRRGEAVIVAHAASLALAEESGVLRVLVTASANTRAERLSGPGRMAPRDAAKTVRDSDRERLDYFKRFYGISREEPTHYDLVVNTDELDFSRAAAVIVAAARSLG